MIPNAVNVMPRPLSDSSGINCGFNVELKRSSGLRTGYAYLVIS